MRTLNLLYDSVGSSNGMDFMEEGFHEIHPVRLDSIPGVSASTHIAAYEASCTS